MIKNILNFKLILVLALFTGFMSSEHDNLNLSDELNSDVQIDDIDMNALTEDIAEVDLDLEAQVTPGQFFQHKVKKCFTLVFPVTMVFPDGSTQEFQNREEMGSALKSWKQANPNSSEHPEFQFPITVTLRDGSTKIFDSKEAFNTFIKNCRGDKPKRHDFKKCFTPVFPLTIIFPDGTEQSVDNNEALRTAIMEWRQNNPNATGHPEFKFPFDVTLQNGDIVTVNSKEELRNIVKSCKRDRKHKPHFDRCFKIVFPITIEFPDGSTQSIENKEDLRTTIISWIQNNPDVDGRPHIVFPFDIEVRGGKVITVNNKQDLIKIMRKCKGRKGKGGRGNHGGRGNG